LRDSVTTLGVRPTALPRSAWNCCRVAWINLRQHPRRLAVTLSGTTVALLLLLMQLAFLDAARAKVVALFELFDFDLAVIPDTYQFLASEGGLETIRLNQAQAVGGVAETFRLNIAGSNWTDPATKRRSNLLLIGADNEGAFIGDAALRRDVADLRDGHSVLVDIFSSADFGPLVSGAKAEIAGREFSVTGHFALGLFFYADGSAILRNSDFDALPRGNPHSTTIGLVRLAPGADGQVTKARLAAALPRDVEILTRAELIRQEQDYFTSLKPIGIMLLSGMIVAFLAGCAILFQALSTEITERTREFAIWKAIGFGPGFVYGIALAQMAILASGAFVLAALLGGATLAAVERSTHLPTALRPEMALFVFGTAIAMCLVALPLVVRRIARADPAELY
jgi:putative ABC transport system permease protein